MDKSKAPNSITTFQFHSVVTKDMFSIIAVELANGGGSGRKAPKADAPDYHRTEFGMEEIAYVWYKLYEQGMAPKLPALVESYAHRCLAKMRGKK